MINNKIKKFIFINNKLNTWIKINDKILNNITNSDRHQILNLILLPNPDWSVEIHDITSVQESSAYFKPIRK